MNNSFVALQAQAGAQMGSLVKHAKRAAVVTACALGVSLAATGTSFAQDYGYGQPQQQGASGGELMKGAAIGGVLGNIFGKITDNNRTVTTVLGAGIGGLIANQNAKAEQSAAQPGKLVLESSRRDRVATFNSEALVKRVQFQQAFKSVQEAEIDAKLSGAAPMTSQAYKDALRNYATAETADRQASQQFVGIYESLQKAGYDVSAFSASYAKLRNPMNPHDTSLTKMMEQSTANMGYQADPTVSSRSAGPSF